MPEVIKDIGFAFESSILKKAVIKDIEARVKMGFEKYKTKLKTFNGRDCLNDAY